MQDLHILGIILCIVTLIGALGGSMRFQENFYEEVFDLVDSMGEDENENEKPPTEDPAEDIGGIDASFPVQAEVESKPIPEPDLSEIENVGVDEETEEVVEAYDQDEVFATIA